MKSRGSDGRVCFGTRRAMVLIIVLVVVAALSLGALSFSALMISEREVVHTTGRRIQATALAESGIEAARLFLREYGDVRYTEGIWYEDPESFQGVTVCDDASARNRGRFAIVAPMEDELGGGIRFGLECESAKLNLNTLLESESGGQGEGESGQGQGAGESRAGGESESSSGGVARVSGLGSDGASDGGEKSARERLMVLPGMTEEIADCILDWLDEDDEPREFGAEGDYYESLDPPYRPTNGPMRSLEELLFVKGVTVELLYGGDRNRNGRLDDNESESTAFLDNDTGVPVSHRGWSAYLTLFSREKSTQPDGSEKIDLNQDDAEQLYADLEEAFGSEWATFIVGYRQQEELYTGEGSEESGEGGDQQQGAMGSDRQGGQSGGGRGGEGRGGMGAGRGGGRGGMGEGGRGGGRGGMREGRGGDRGGMGESGRGGGRGGMGEGRGGGRGGQGGGPGGGGPGGGGPGGGGPGGGGPGGGGPGGGGPGGGGPGGGGPGGGGPGGGPGGGGMGGRGGGSGGSGRGTATGDAWPGVTSTNSAMVTAPGDDSQGEGGDGDQSNSEGEQEEEVEYADHATGQLDLTKPLNQEISSIFDLIGSRIKVTYQGSDKATVVSPLFPDDSEAMRDYLPQLMDVVKAGNDAEAAGRINVNLAPAAVLASVPGIDEELADEIVAQRPADPLSVDTYQRYAAWLLIEGLVSLDEMKQLSPYLTGGGCVHKVQSVGFFDEGGPIVRLEAVLDASESPPRMLLLKNLTPLGAGFEPVELGAEESASSQ